jgi:sigma-B regulation protein RsbU (phosphoserine phosphatase)
MFVTVGCGLLNTETGCIRYASAGHELPLLRHAEGTVAPLSVEIGPAIGIEPAADYHIEEKFMAPGDTLVLFTDGVTEAEAQDGSLFGLDRLSELLRQSSEGDPVSLVNVIVETVTVHASGFHATDDLTVLAVRWNPPHITVQKDENGVRWTMKPDVSYASIRPTQQMLRAILAARDVDAEQIGEMELIAEEILTNIIRVTIASARSIRMSVECTLMPAQIVLTVRDDGAEFNPFGRSDPNLSADIADRNIGGLGIPIIRHLADGCSHSRVDEWNVLTVRLGRRLRSN